MSKRKIKSRYAQQRREAKAEYIKENGSPRGWKSSDSFRRIANNQRSAEYRYRKKVVRLQRERFIKKSKGEVGQTNLRVIQDWSMYHSVLGYGDNPRAKIRDQFAIFNERKDKETYLRIETPKGAVGIYRTLYDADKAIQSLYQMGTRMQAYDGDNYGMLVAAVYGETDTERFVNIYTMDISGINGDFDLPDIPPSSDSLQ